MTRCLQRCLVVHAFLSSSFLGPFLIPSFSVWMCVLAWCTRTGKFSSKEICAQGNEQWRRGWVVWAQCRSKAEVQCTAPAISGGMNEARRGSGPTDEEKREVEANKQHPFWSDSDFKRTKWGVPDHLQQVFRRLSHCFSQLTQLK